MSLDANGVSELVFRHFGQAYLSRTCSLSTEQGFLNIDNNASERALRAVAVGRKNWLFAGSDAGGKTAAVLYTMTQTCRRHGLDPFVYLQDLLTRLPLSTSDDLPSFLPQRRTPTTSR